MVLVPADALVYDRVLEGVLIVVEARGSGFHFDEDHFLDALFVHAFEDEEIDRRSDEFGLGGAEREIGKVGVRGSANMPPSTERDRRTAAFFASGNLSAVVFSPTSLPISYIKYRAAAMKRIKTTIANAESWTMEGMR